MCRKTFFAKKKLLTCPACKKLDEAHFTRIEHYLEEFPNSNALQIAEALDLPAAVVVSYITEGRLGIAKGYFEQLQP